MNPDRNVQLSIALIGDFTTNFQLGDCLLYLIERVVVVVVVVVVVAVVVVVVVGLILLKSAAGTRRSNNTHVYSSLSLVSRPFQSK